MYFYFICVKMKGEKPCKTWQQICKPDDPKRLHLQKVMSRKRICKHLLEELLQIEIADIKYLEAEKTLEPEYTSRGIRLDIIVADDKTRIIIWRCR